MVWTFLFRCDLCSMWYPGPLSFFSVIISFLAGNKFNLRWFTPTDEIELCGHATLASAAVLIFGCGKVVFLYQGLNIRQNKTHEKHFQHTFTFTPLGSFFSKALIFCHFGHLLFEPRSEKTGLRGFRPGSIQTRLYSHRR